MGWFDNYNTHHYRLNYRHHIVLFFHIWYHLHKNFSTYFQPGINLEHDHNFDIHFLLIKISIQCIFSFYPHIRNIFYHRDCRNYQAKRNPINISGIWFDHIPSSCWNHIFLKWLVKFLRNNHLHGHGFHPYTRIENQEGLEYLYHMLNTLRYLNKLNRWRDNLRSNKIITLASILWLFIVTIFANTIIPFKYEYTLVTN